MPIRLGVPACACTPTAAECICMYEEYSYEYVKLSGADYAGCLCVFAYVQIYMWIYLTVCLF